MNLHDNPPLYFECRVVHTPLWYVISLRNLILMGEQLLVIAGAPFFLLPVYLIIMLECD